MKRIFMILIYALLLSVTSQAQTSADASIQAECTGLTNAQVAIRWGYPDYNVNEYMPLFTVPCGVGVRETHLKILDFSSQFEVQTEGGIETSYVIKVVIKGPKGIDSIELDHAGSPDVITRGKNFTLSRSSGPNKYGEQNFRVELPPGETAAVRMVAQSTGDRSNAQMALRWGHKDFHENEYFPIWTVKSGASKEKTFTLNSPKSEFEIQTEGGEGTSYHLSIWLNTGQGVGMQPSIEITHKLHGTDIEDSTQSGSSFQPTKGNEYGEMNVRVNVAGLINRPLPLTPLPGWSNVNFVKQPIYEGNIPYIGQLGSGTSPASTFTKIRSAAPNLIVELVGDGGTTNDCGKVNGRTRLLRANQDLPDSDFKALYGINPTYPKTFVACSYGDVPGFGIQVYTIPK